MENSKKSTQKRSNPKEDALLRSLPPSIKKLGQKIGLKEVSGDYIKTFLKKTLPPSSKGLDETTKYIFEFTKSTRKKKLKSRKSALSARQQRKLVIHQLDKSNTSFQAFIPLHNLWEHYIRELLQLKEKLPNDLSALYQKLIKADYHGCFLVVASSKCPHYVGIRGIITQETRNVFRLVTEENKIKTIPKRGSVFCFELEGKIFKIYGNNFKFLPYDRMKLKNKTKSIVNFY